VPRTWKNGIVEEWNGGKGLLPYHFSLLKNAQNVAIAQPTNFKGLK
jgi:hypothetical protein